LEGDEIFLLVDRDYAVAAHYGPDASQVGMLVFEIEGGDFEVVLGAEDAGGLEAQDAGGEVRAVGVGVGRAAWDEEGNAAADLSGGVAESPGHDAIDAEDRLVVFAMNMGKGDAGEGRDGEFEQIEGATGFVAGLKEGDAHLADADRFVHSHLQFRSIILQISARSVIFAVDNCIFLQLIRRLFCCIQGVEKGAGFG
jgi:hypothetical protein